MPEEQFRHPYHHHHPEPPPIHHPHRTYRPGPPGFLARTACPTDLKTKVLIVFKNPQVDNPLATHQGLGITALNVALSLRDLGVEADAPAIANGEHLWAQLAGDWSSYTHIALSAPFIDPSFLEKMFQHFPEKHFALIYHSNLGFLAQDRFAGISIPKYLELQQRCPNFVLAANSQELSTSITAATGLPFTWLPNIYHAPHTVRPRAGWASPQPLNLGLFGGCRVLKNWLTAGVAAMVIERTLHVDVRLHVSQDRDEGAGSTRAILDALLALNPRVTLVPAPWMSHDDFKRYLFGMDLLLQVSHTETFNNVTADGVICGVGTVVSDAIEWAPSEWVAKADSAISVAEVGCAILRDTQTAAKGAAALDAHNEVASQAWMQWLAIR